MRIFFDTEFIEDGRTIDLLSIGMVREDGKEYYAVSADADQSKANPWVAKHVLPHLRGPLTYRFQMAEQILEFAGPNPMFWAWYAAYDWVALCQLYGAMVDLPPRWPMYVHDFRQDIRDPGALVIQNAQDGPEHHALSDARWLRRAVHHYETQGQS